MRPTVTLSRRTPALLLIVLIAIVLIAGACAGSTALRSVGDSVTRDASGEAGLPAGAEPAAAASAAPEMGGYDRAGAAVPSDLLIVKTGALALQVKGLDDAVNAATTKVTARGGYVSGSQRSGDGDSPTATATYRIPAAQWDATLAELRGLGDKVVSEQTQTEEVTGQVIDLGARIANLQATEAALQGIMARAVKISDVLAVQEQLTEVRGEIEQLSAEKKHLEEQAAFGTLTVTYALAPTPAVTVAQKGFDLAAEIDRALASLVAIGQALATAGIWFAIVLLPVLLGLAIVGLIVIVVGRRMRASGRRPGSGPIVPTANA